ncbi:MAG: hypothetical protein WBE80_00450, partial [Methylocella sp.]
MELPRFSAELLVARPVIGGIHETREGHPACAHRLLYGVWLLVELPENREAMNGRTSDALVCP